jgi:GNAT superfamily N-acetyltransferase
MGRVYPRLCTTGWAGWYDGHVFQICIARSCRDPGFLQLLSQFLIESGEPLPDTAAFEHLETAIQMNRIRYFMALETDQRVVGVVSMTFGFSTVKMQPIALLSDLYVHPGHRGRGAARALVLAAMDDAHAQGCAWVTSETSQGLEGIFERYGWEHTSTMLRYMPDLEGPPPSLALTGDFTFD